MTNLNDIKQLFNEHYQKMYQLAAVLLRDDDLARDFVHDVFASILDNAPTVTITPGYLLKATRNRCLNHIRNSEIHRKIQSLYFLENEEYEREKWPDEETVDFISNIIEKDVAPQGRCVITLRFNEGLKFSEIAARMGISEQAVYGHLRHALIFIRKKLEQHGQI